jgi:hypothetical protein
MGAKANTRSRCDARLVIIPEMTRREQVYVGGEWVAPAGSGSMEVIDPTIDGGRDFLVYVRKTKLKAAECVCA